MTQPSGLPPGISLVNIGNGLVQQRFDIALAFALAHVAERTAWRLQSLDPVEAEQLVGCGVWEKAERRRFSMGSTKCTNNLAGTIGAGTVSNSP